MEVVPLATADQIGRLAVVRHPVLLDVQAAARLHRAGLPPRGRRQQARLAARVKSGGAHHHSESSFPSIERRCSREHTSQ